MSTKREKKSFFFFFKYFFKNMEKKSLRRKKIDVENKWITWHNDRVENLFYIYIVK